MPSRGFLPTTLGAVVVAITNFGSATGSLIRVHPACGTIWHAHHVQA